MSASPPACRSAWPVALLGFLLAGTASVRAEDRRPSPTDDAEVQAATQSAVPPGILRRPIELPAEASAETALVVPLSEPIFQSLLHAPLGFSGPSGVRPSEGQEDSHFVPIEDRWRIGYPEWDRYGEGQRIGHDVPYELGHWWDPFNLNVLKGDYPIIGQHTFLEITAATRVLVEGREVPTPANGFESTARPGESQVFGRPDQFVYSQFFRLSLDLFHGDAAFKPVDWRIKVTPVFDVNALDVQELGVVSPDVRHGTSRSRTWFALEEWFVEGKIADLSPEYDFVSVRAGSQFFDADFRGFLFTDTNRAVRFFGTAFSNRDQFNLAAFKQSEKDTNSDLNTFEDRHQTVLVANYYRQDLFFPGYTGELSVLYNSDRPTFHFDKNGFLARPDPVGAAQPHGLDIAYLGWAGNGHIGRVNISHQFYWALGRDSLNPLADQGVDVNAQMAALELSYDRDWVRFRTSLFWASGDSKIGNSHATGFDTIVDDPNFAGGEFSYWQRQPIKLLGVNLKQPLSLVPDLRSSKFEGQSNFVNPGLLLFNFGMDFDVTPRLRIVNNYNLLWFDETEVLEQFVFQPKVHHFIGADLSLGVEYRPLLSNNVILKCGVATLVPGQGFKDLYNNSDRVVDPLVAGFMELTLAY